MRWIQIMASMVAGLGITLSAHAADVDLYGQVNDAGRGDGIVGAKVTVFKKSGGDTWKVFVSTRTNDKGVYEIAKIPVGRTRVIFDRITYKSEVAMFDLTTPPLRHPLNVDLIQLSADTAYFKKVGESKAARVNRVLETAGAEQAAALYGWEWFSCVIGLSADQTKLCADGLYGSVSAKVAKPTGLGYFATVDPGALLAIDQKLGQGITPTLPELQQRGVPPEVAWFTKWQRLEKSGASGEQIELTRKTLFENWKLPSDKNMSYEMLMRNYPTLKSLNPT